MLRLTFCWVMTPSKMQRHDSLLTSTFSVPFLVFGHFLRLTFTLYLEMSASKRQRQDSLFLFVSTFSVAFPVGRQDS